MKDGGVFKKGEGGGDPSGVRGPISSSSLAGEIGLGALARELRIDLKSFGEATGDKGVVGVLGVEGVAGSGVAGSGVAGPGVAGSGVAGPGGSPSHSAKPPGPRSRAGVAAGSMS